MYISLPRDNVAKSASLVFVTNNFGDYRWHLRVTQIVCNRYLKSGFSFMTRQKRAFKPQFATLLDRQQLFSLPAPQGCLQYYTASHGIVESFNFGEYFNNLDYAICIERLPNTCRILFTASDYDWSIDTSTVYKQYSGVGDNDCREDYLTIPGASQTGDGITYDRYCGGKLSYFSQSPVENPIVTKANGPIVLRFHTDYLHEPTEKSGFRLRYEQLATDCLPMYPYGNPFASTPATPIVANLVEEKMAKERSQGRTNAKLMTFVN